MGITMTASALIEQIRDSAKKTIRDVSHLAVYLAIACSIAISSFAPAQAQTSSNQAALKQFDVPAGPLGAALLRFGEQSGLQFSVGTDLTLGKSTSGLRGKYNAEDGLRALLSGTGLVYRFTGARTVVIERAPESGDARVLGPLRIEGAQGSRNTASSANGSSDQTATENSGSYGAASTSLVSKSAQSVLETPQSVSVITRQQLNDQNTTDLRSALSQMPGIVSRPGGSDQEMDFYSRGIRVDKFRVDGGSAITTRDLFSPPFDMALYDHIELLRGADGMLSGYGKPGGVVNLVRKRPLDHSQAIVELQAASWNNFRSMIDVTAPLAWDGRLRGRAVVTNQDKDYFYGTAKDKTQVVYSVLEADLSSNFVARGGFSFSDQQALPWSNGLPLYADGKPLPLSRKVCLCFRDADYSLTSKELFVQGEYQINDGWSLDAKITRYDQHLKRQTLEPSGGVNPDGSGYGAPNTPWSWADHKPTADSADLALKGAFSLFGRQHQVSIGGNYTKTRLQTKNSIGLTYGGAEFFGYVEGVEPTFTGDFAQFYSTFFDVLNFNPSDPKYRPYVKYPNSDIDQSTKEYALFASISTDVTDKLKVNLGFRYSYFTTFQGVTTYCFPSPFSADRSKCNRTVVDGDGNEVVEEVGIGEPLNFSQEVALPDRSKSWPPSVSAIYKLSDSTSIYASYTDVYESNRFNVGPDYKPIAPATGFNSEIGANFLSEDGKSNGRMAVYYGKQDGFAVFLYDDPAYRASHPNGSCCFVGGDSVKYTTYGLDAEYSGRVTSALQVAASYNYNRNKDEINYPDYQSARPISSFSPRHLLKVWATYEFGVRMPRLARLSASAGFNAQSSSYESGSTCVSFLQIGTDPVTGAPIVTCDGTQDYDFTRSAFAVFSARIGYKLDERWQLAMNVGNLFDKTYFARTSGPGGFNWYGEPRSIAVVLSGTF